MNSIKELPPHRILLDKEITDKIVPMILSKEAIDEIKRRGQDVKVIVCLPTAENIKFFK
jgi:hypothetical protein